MTRILISLGSNQHRPIHQVEWAIANLNPHFTDFKVSQFYRTEPVGPVEQTTFINAAVSAETNMVAPELLHLLHDLETTAGRDRTHELSQGPRNLDLDLILYGDEIRKDAEIEIPHPRFRQRRFVLEPAAEIEPGLVDPVSSLCIAELLKQCDDPSWVKLIELENSTL